MANNYEETLRQNAPYLYQEIMAALKEEPLFAGFLIDPITGQFDFSKLFEQGGYETPYDEYWTVPGMGQITSGARSILEKRIPESRRFNTANQNIPPYYRNVNEQYFEEQKPTDRYTRPFPFSEDKWKSRPAPDPDYDPTPAPNTDEEYKWDPLFKKEYLRQLFEEGMGMIRGLQPTTTANQPTAYDTAINTARGAGAINYPQGEHRHPTLFPTPFDVQGRQQVNTAQQNEPSIRNSIQKYMPGENVYKLLLKDFMAGKPQNTGSIVDTYSNPPYGSNAEDILMGRPPYSKSTLFPGGYTPGPSINEQTNTIFNTPKTTIPTNDTTQQSPSIVSQMYGVTPKEGQSINDIMGTIINKGGLTPYTPSNYNTGPSIVDTLKNANPIDYSKMTNYSLGPSITNQMFGGGGAYNPNFDQSINQILNELLRKYMNR